MTPLLAVTLELARPQWLAVLLLAPVFAALTWRTARGRPRTGDVTALIARCVLLSALALALSVPRIRLDAAFRSVAYVLDTSESIPAQSTSQAREFIKRSAVKRGDDDDASFVVFADGAAVEAPFTRISAAQRLEPVPIDPATLGSVLPRGETDIESALHLARAGFPPGGSRRVVLVTDGNQTRGDAVAAVTDLIDRGVDVQILPLRYRRDSEVLVRKLVAPAASPRNQPVPIRAVVDNLTDTEITAMVRFFIAGDEVAANEETLAPGRSVFEMGYPFAGAGFHDIEVRVDPALDGNPHNNVGRAMTQVRGPGRVLVVSTMPESDLADALAQELEFPVDAANADALPPDPGGYVPYDCIVLENVPAFALSPVQLNVLSSAVRELGVGLVCVGGDKAYGPGGYAGTKLDEILPLSSEIRQKRVLPSGALVVVLHTCEFPEGNEAARQITRAAIDALSAQDEIGVIQYGRGGDEWLIELQPVGRKSRHYAALSGAFPGDMPSFDSSLQVAEAGLRKSTAAAKHMIIISDGDATPPNDKLVARIHEQRITISTVCVDPHTRDGAKTMKRLSSNAGGNHYDVSSKQLSRLPQIFIKEAVTVRRSAWRDEAFQASVVGSHTMLRGFSQEMLPALYGYTVTTLKDKTEPLMGAPHDDPLLATWRHGLGEVTAWASDASKRWSQDWVPWGGYGRFWGQVVRATTRALERPGVRVVTDIEGGTASVVMDALEPDGAFRNGLSVSGAAIQPDGSTVEFKVVQTGPGRYEGKFAATQVGTYLANLLYTAPDAPADARPQQAVAGVSVAYSAEHLAQSSDERFFALVEAAGATIIDPDPELPADGTPPPDPADTPWQGELLSSSEPVDLWPWIAALAALLLVTDVAVRRLRIKLPKRKAKKPPAAADAPKSEPTATRIARPAPSGAYVAPHESADGPPAAKKQDDKKAAPAKRPAPGAPDGGLLGAKRRAKKQQDWEEQS